MMMWRALQALEEEVAALKEESAENEESLTDCLTSLGQEEAKVCVGCACGCGWG